MQDIDFELTYEPGKDEADPLDYLSRHPLPIKGNDSTERMIRKVIENEHAISLKRMKAETAEDKQMIKLSDAIITGRWEKNRKDPDIAPFYSVRQELYVAEGLIFRMNKVIVPHNLRRKVVKSAHSMGHLGVTKTKAMLREKYWFPSMNQMVDEIVGQCYECQVATKQHTQEPIKMTVIPGDPWEVISVDFGGPYPDGHYNLVAIDKRTRYPEVEITHSTAAKPTIERLHKIFATHGIPRRVETDNGPPFQSQEFADFAEEQGFYHHRVTPEHARANGEVESFMKNLNKTEQIAHLRKDGYKQAIQQMLMGYRATPHIATGITPYEALMGREVRTKLDAITITDNSDTQIMINERDKKYKEKIKENAENRNTKEHNYIVGDYVLLKQSKKTKWTTAYEPAFYIIYKVKGSTIAARRITDGRTIERDANKFKLANSIIQNDQDQDIESTEDDNWRETLLSGIDVDPEPNEKTNQIELQQETAAATLKSPDRTIDDSENKHSVNTQKRSTRTRTAPRKFRDYVM